MRSGNIILSVKTWSVELKAFMADRGLRMADGSIQNKERFRQADETQAAVAKYTAANNHPHTWLRQKKRLVSTHSSERKYKLHRVPLVGRTTGGKMVEKKKAPSTAAQP